MDNTQTTLIYKLTQLRLMIAAATVQALLRKAKSSLPALRAAT